MEPQTTEQMPRKKGVYNKERYEQHKEEILKYRREWHRTIHKEDLNIKVSTGRNVFNVICIQCHMYSMSWIPEPTWWEGNTIWLLRCDGKAE